MGTFRLGSLQWHSSLNTFAPAPSCHRMPPAARRPGTHVAGCLGARNNGVGAYGVLPGVRIFAGALQGPTANHVGNLGNGVALLEAMK